LLQVLVFMDSMAEQKSKRTPNAPEAPRSGRVQVTVTVNKKLLRRMDAVARETARNRSEMMDRIVEHYVATNPEAMRILADPDIQRLIEQQDQED
jgi:predicted transcriptional regulator